MNIDVFGKFISDRRKALGMTQSDLAEKLNVTPKAVSRWERCIGYPDIESFQKLAAALEVNVDSLFACKIKEDSLNNEEILQIIQTSVEIDRKNNRIQERIVSGLIVCVSILTGILFYTSGHGNIGGSVFFGLMASCLVVSVYYLLAADDINSRKIYTVIVAVFLVVIIGVLWLVLK